MMMGGRLLPYDAEVEWIKSTAGAYVDTGIKASGNLRIRTTLYNFFSEEFLTRWCFGAANGYLNKTFGLFINTDDKCVHFRYSNNDYKLLIYSAYPQIAVVEIGNRIIQIGEIKHNYTTRTFTSDYSFTLFAINYGGNIIGGNTSMGDTYVTDGVTTLDLIPVRKGNVGYMYDKVSGQLFGNAGTGQFIIGPDK